MKLVLVYIGLFVMGCAELTPIHEPDGDGGSTSSSSSASSTSSASSSSVSSSGAGGGTGGSAETGGGSTCDPRACARPVGFCWMDETCIDGACSEWTPKPAGQFCPGGGVCDGDGNCVDTGVCGAVAFAVCTAKVNACVPGTRCYDFKACYEDVQGDDSAVTACIQANTQGAREWMHITKCECACGWAPSGFCDGSDYGHISG